MKEIELGARIALNQIKTYLAERREEILKICKEVNSSEQTKKLCLAIVDSVESTITQMEMSIDNGSFEKALVETIKEFICATSSRHH